MKNFVTINGEVKELTEEQAQVIASAIKEWGNEKKKKTQLSDISAGEVFRIGEYEFIVLEHRGEETAVILKNLLKKGLSFGFSNNYKGSNVDSACCEFASLVAAIVGKDNMVEHTVDLTADDGLKDYGSITRLVSSITADIYRRYVEILDKYNPNAWWWLASPVSTKRHENDRWIKCVSPSGCLNGAFYFNVTGVRPFCILKSTIFVSR